MMPLGVRFLPPAVLQNWERRLKCLASTKEDASTRIFVCDVLHGISWADARGSHETVPNRTYQIWHSSSFWQEKMPLAVTHYTRDNEGGRRAPTSTSCPLGTLRETVWLSPSAKEELNSAIFPRFTTRRCTENRVSEPHETPKPSQNQYQRGIRAPSYVLPHDGVERNLSLRPSCPTTVYGLDMDDDTLGSRQRWLCGSWTQYLDIAITTPTTPPKPLPIVQNVNSTLTIFYNLTVNLRPNRCSC